MRVRHPRRPGERATVGTPLEGRNRSYIFRDEALRATSLVTEMAAELAVGTVSLLEAGHVFAAAALMRQLIEAEYLVWFFSVDRNEAARWSRATPEEIRKMFAPKSIRERADGTFRATEYWTHCDLGGHPNPKAVLLLFGHDLRYDAIEYPRLELQWADLCQHLVRLWERLLEVFRDDEDWTKAAGSGEVASAIEYWRAHDKVTSEALFLLSDESGTATPLV